ncbi:TonB-dependent receptor [Novosphingobium flavum]|uniref:TonB-dependent receptor n=1 Tax=Novosphingobium flavum TaxID=1778672 RepID=A0A7X1KLD2_9SPHN|nr:TonB-dependent receptor [Novosphingobium flavum]MBC2665459.1 TonB-dependent receptor [Novosphingobium flavum]
MRKITGIALLTGVSILAVQPALAQGSAASTTAATEDIVVTGSRVVSNGNNMPTPTTVVNIQEIEKVNPGTVADQLNSLPQFAGSQGQFTQPQAGSANNGNPNPNANVLNLRNFGPTRNLILMDGHRVAPNAPNGTVDIDMIPQLLLQRVDVVTGGVSAVYGADAVTGVVNFITDSKFKGLKVNGQYGISNLNDGRQQTLGAAWGANIGERGHIELSYEYRNDEGIDKRSSRDWGRARYLTTALTSAAGTATYRFDSNTTRYDGAFGGLIGAIGGLSSGTLTNPLATAPGSYFSPTGVVLPMSGTLYGTRTYVNGTGSYFDPSLKASLRMHQFFGRFDYELTDNIKFYAKAFGTINKNGGYSIYNATARADNASNAVPVFLNNPLLPVAARNAMLANLPSGTTPAAFLAANPYATFAFSRTLGDPSTPQYRQFTDTTGHNFTIDTGFNGNFGGWKWEVAGVYTKNVMRVLQTNAMNSRKMDAALDVVLDSSGNPVCYVSTAAGQASLTPAMQQYYAGCVPFTHAFGGQISQAEADWFFDPLESTTTTKMYDVEAYIAGSPFSTWAGPVTIAVSGQARRLTYALVASSTPASPTNPLDCSGLRLLFNFNTNTTNCGRTTQAFLQGETLGRPEIGVTVKEAAIEAGVPLLQDFVLAKSLTFNGAARYTNYSTTGGIWSWKTGLDWKVTDELTIRTTRSHDIRAPTMHELYQPSAFSSSSVQDFLIRPSVLLNGTGGNPAPALSVAQGNSSLVPEKADTFTLGAVYRPEWMPGFSIAVDYFNIRVKDAILSFNGTQQATQLACISSGGSSPLCALIVRGNNNCCTDTSFANAATTFYTTSLNVGRQKTNGVDIESNYVTRVLNRPFSIRALFSYQPHNITIDLSGATVDYGGAGGSFATWTPRWRGTIVARMGVTDNFDITVQERYRGPINWAPKDSTTTYIFDPSMPPNIAARWYTNLNLGYKIKQGEIYFNVQNLFNRSPAPFNNLANNQAGLASPVSGDDPIGRYFTFGFRLKI